MFMQLSINVLLVLLSTMSMFAYARVPAVEVHRATTSPIDTTISDYDLKQEESYFAIQAILEEGVEIEDISDSIGPHVKGLTLAYRERIYKEQKRFAYNGTAVGGFGNAAIFLPMLGSLLQGDGVGIMLGVAGVGCLLVGPSPIMPALGLGLLIAGAVRECTVNSRNNRHNEALSEALRLPKDFSYSISPGLRCLPDGTYIPNMQLSVQF